MHRITVLSIIGALIFSCASKEKSPRPREKPSPVASNQSYFDSLKRYMESPAASQAKVAGFAKTGDTVKVGDLCYRVKSISFRKSIYSGGMHETARGVFLFVMLTVTNNGPHEWVMGDSLCRVVDSADNRYSCASEACAIFEMGGGKTLCSKKSLPKGFQSGNLIFDVPTSTAGYRLEVNGGFWNGRVPSIDLRDSSISM